MSIRALLVLAVIVAVVGGVWLFSGGEETPIRPAPVVALVPEVPSLDVELSNQFIERFINEDDDIQAALRGEVIVEAATGEAVGDPDRKSNEDVLFEMMAPWVYIRYQMVDGVKGGQFKNMNSQRKSQNLRIGATLAGAQILDLDPVKATVRFADATQELFLVSETPPPYDPSVPRTPEQIAEAQLRYKEMYMKQFIVSGKEYERLRGKPTVDIPPPEIQLEQKKAYLEQAQAFAAQSGAKVPPEALISTEDLTEKEKELYETYRAILERRPEEVQEAIAAELQRVEEAQRNLQSRRQAPSTGAVNEN